MRRAIRKAIPSMYHRRLVLLCAALAPVLAVLAAQLVLLTISKHESLQREAESRLIRRDWIPTIRGRILDRHGRVLAQDRPGYAAAIEYEVLTGAWPEQTAARLARQVHPDAWPAADNAGRERLNQQVEQRLERHIDAMWDRLARTTRIERERLQREARAIERRVKRAHEAVAEARRRAMLKERAEAGIAVTDEDRAAIARTAAAPIREQRDAHAVASGLSDDVGFALLRLARERTVLARPEGRDPVTIPLMPGLEVIDTPDRVHPFGAVAVDVDRASLPGPLRTDAPATIEVDNVAWHVLGTMRSGPQAEDIRARAGYLRTTSGASGAIDRGRYRPGDLVGHRGVERAKEHRLRGDRGLNEFNLLTEQTTRTAPDAGRDVRLTLDIMLQARVRAALDPALGLTRLQPWHGASEDAVGEPRNGAAVVLDVDTGDILAMVSTPTPTDEDGQDDGWSPNPYVNRAIAAPYPPGSIVKPMILAGAVSRGRHTLGSGVVCTGHLLENREDLYRCWIYRRYPGVTHSPTGEPLTARQAIQHSCNIFFYELGRRLGVERVADIYRDFGLGEPFELGIGHEWPGSIGDGAEPGIRTEGLHASAGIMMGIGQGPLSWTPLHAASAYATLARGGVHLAPRLFEDASPPRPRDLELDPRAVDAAIEGLRLVTNDPRGTGSTLTTGEGREPMFNAPGVEVLGKTGTAQAPPALHDPDGTGPAEPSVVRSGDHAWFVALIGPEGDRPRYAAAVIVEHAGSGGRVAGPVVNQIAHALVREGYIEQPAESAAERLASEQAP